MSSYLTMCECWPQIFQFVHVLSNDPYYMSITDYKTHGRASLDAKDLFTFFLQKSIFI